MLDILVCPICLSELKFIKTQSELICIRDKLAYPINNHIILMQEEKARKIEDLELLKYKRKISNI